MGHHSTGRSGRTHRYRKPLALSLAITGLGLMLSVTVSQVVMNDPDMRAAVTRGAETLGRSVAEMKGAVAEAPAKAPIIEDVVNVSSAPEAKVKVTRHGQGMTGWSHKHIIVGDDLAD